MNLTKQYIFIGAGFLFFAFVIFFIRKQIIAPPTFVTPYQISIESGQTLFSISKELKNDGVIRSERLFEVLMLTLGSDKTISQGKYYFDHPVSVVEVALRISGREFGITRTKVTIPEGFSNKEIAKKLGKEIEGFDENVFLSLSSEYEGYLFPDTYIFFPWVTPDTVVNTLRKTFEEKMTLLSAELKSSKRSFSDIIIMASIIEKEASGDGDREIISGILWKRIDKKIPLQVDAPFLYILGKGSAELTRKDLSIDSPFNTYRYKGLPPTPIGNPGLASIKAALTPKESPYLYYLHDKDGTIHYAKTYEEHKKNIRNYLK